MPLRVVFIGAGSVGFTRRLAQDMLMVPELQDTVFALHDIDRRNLDMVAQLLKKDIKANLLPAKVVTSLNRRKALEGADYVINCTRIGGLEAFATDIDIPLKYGVDQCVGDTLCAGGIMYGQRNIPQIRAFSKDALEVGNASRPGGMLFLNYANPMAMNTWAALDAYDAGEGINTVGLCHGVDGGWQQIAAALARYHGDEDESSSKVGQYGETGLAYRDLVQIVCAGINHQTWYLKVLYRGREVGQEELLAAFEQHDTLAETEKVRIDVLRRFGVYSTESNGHLSEYLPWYRKRPKEIKKWISMNSWINGQTAGYLRVCTEDRNWFETDFPKWLDEAGQPLETWKRSTEHGSYIIESLETGRPYRGFFNVRNRGVITNLPEDCVIEAPGYVDRTGLHMMSGITLPQACAATCMASVNVQRMSKDAAITGDVTLLKQAVLHDPLVGAVCNPDEVWQMTDEMLVAQRPWLPNYRKADLDAASKRMDHATIQTKPWAGAARAKVKSVAQLRKSGGNVMDADKGKSRTAGVKRRKGAA
ncbi:MAG: alpha-galactosidase [Planctomycetota bacterium]